MIWLAIASLAIAVLSFIGGPLSAYIAVRVALATVTTKLDDMVKRFDRFEDNREALVTRIAAVEARCAALEAQQKT